jgi:hypothetical protein
MDPLVEDGLAHRFMSTSRREALALGLGMEATRRFFDALDVSTPGSQSSHRNRCQTVVLTAIAELSIVVASPAQNGAVATKGTSVMGAHRHRSYGVCRLPIAPKR